MHTFTLLPFGTSSVLQFEAELQLPEAPPIQLVVFPVQLVTAINLKVAVTARFEFMVTVHVPEPLQAPPQPTKTEPALGEAVKVTLVPAEKFAEQVVVGQLMPAGLLITVPPPVPASATLRVNEVVVPVPVRATVCMLPEMLLELSVTVNVAFSTPVCVGEKRMKMVHDESGANCPPAEPHVSPEPSWKSLGEIA
jgi:hypothetical protein